MGFESKRKLEGPDRALALIRRRRHLILFALSMTIERDEWELLPRRGFSMAYTEFRCLVCNQLEDQCTCVKYCALCHGDYAVRLTEDGQYYCVDCRDACDFKTQEQI